MKLVRPYFLAAAAFFLATPAFAQTQTLQTQWRQSETPHFKFFYEGRALPSGLSIGFERLHGKLRLHLGLLAPWIGKEKINVYLYQTEASYKAGEFKPPSWSKGVSRYQTRTVVLYEDKDQEVFFQTAVHEMTHLLFTGFFREKNSDAPRWLEEGIAMLMEDLAGADEKNAPWLSYMKRKNSWTPQALGAFMGSEPKESASSKEAGDWYVQAYSIGRFLFNRGKLPFKVFCDKLRSGESETKAFWSAYRYKDAQALQTAWLDWLKQQQK
ncbi:MAG: hypothetical protein HYT79_08230 [Elusimicrobia bacterium]|nr:hypothetical protein [Elusimicrobiota bacterium]